MAYADFTYYATSFLGTAIAESDFPRLALRASAVIDQLTFGRASVDFAAEDNVVAIKNAMCAIADEIQAIADEGITGVIQSETIGQNSVTYVTGSTQTYTDMQRYLNGAYLYLANTGLLFSGFNTGEYSGYADE